MPASCRSRDGEISAEEIDNTSTALKKLDINGDGRLTRDELRPERAPGFGGSSQGRFGGQGRGGFGQDGHLAVPFVVAEGVEPVEVVPARHGVWI